MNSKHLKYITIILLAICLLAFSGCDYIGRLFSISHAPEPAEPLAWTFTDGKIELNLLRTPELTLPGSAVRLEEKGLTKRVLLVFGDDSNYYAFENRCPNDNRRIDYQSGKGSVRCCGFDETEWNHQGEVINGSAIGPLGVLPMEVLGNKIVITVRR